MTAVMVDGLRYANLQPEWARELEELELAIFPTISPEDLYDEPELFRLANAFPEGNFVVFDGDTAIGMGLGLLVEFDFAHTDHTLKEICGEGGVGNHDAAHPWYYGTDISVRPEYRGRGVGKTLYELRKGFVRENNKRGIVAGGVLPGFADHKHEMTADEYIRQVTAGQLYDATLTFQLKNGFRAPAAIPNYVNDESVDHWASLIVWDNPDYQPEPAA